MSKAGRLTSPFAFFASLDTTERTRNTSALIPPLLSPSLTPYRLTAVISNCGQILERHTFPNWLRVVSRLNRERCIPPATIYQSGETFTATEFSVNSEDSRSMLLLWLILYLGTHVKPQVTLLTHACLAMALGLPP